MPSLNISFFDGNELSDAVSEAILPPNLLYPASHPSILLFASPLRDFNRIRAPVNMALCMPEIAPLVLGPFPLPDGPPLACPPVKRHRCLRLKLHARRSLVSFWRGCAEHCGAVLPPIPPPRSRHRDGEEVRACERGGGDSRSREMKGDGERRGRARWSANGVER